MSDSYYGQGYKAGYLCGFTIGSVVTFFLTVALCLLVGAFVPLP